MPFEKISGVAFGLVLYVFAVLPLLLVVSLLLWRELQPEVGARPRVLALGWMLFCILPGCLLADLAVTSLLPPPAMRGFVPMLLVVEAAVVLGSLGGAAVITYCTSTQAPDARRAMKGACIVSAVALASVCWFRLVSSTGLVSLVHWNEGRPAPAGGPKVHVYYIRSQDGGTYRYDLDTGVEVRVGDSAVMDSDARLAGVQEGDAWRLYLISPTEIPVQIGEFPGRVGQQPNDNPGEESFARPEWTIGRAPNLDAASPWKVWTGRRGDEGLSFREGADGKVVRLGMQSLPIGFFVRQWNPRSATICPGDRVVYQLGWDRIVMVNLRSRNGWVLSKGRGCIVAIEP
jgi:hypothetical protein